MTPATPCRPKAEAVMAAVAALPDPERAAVEAIDVRGVPHAQAAEAMGVPLGTVLHRLYRGRSRVVLALAD